MAEHEHFFQILQNKLGTSLRMHPWTAAQLNSSNIRLLSRKNLGEKLLDRILPLLAVSEELTRFAGLQPLKDWSRKRLRELENQQPLDSNLILRLKALREMCRNYGIEKCQSDWIIEIDSDEHIIQSLANEIIETITMYTIY